MYNIIKTIYMKLPDNTKKKIISKEVQEYGTKDKNELEKILKEIYMEKKLTNNYTFKISYDYSNNVFSSESEYSIITFNIQ